MIEDTIFMSLTGDGRDIAILHGDTSHLKV